MFSSEFNSIVDDIKQVIDKKIDLFVQKMNGIVCAGGRGVRLIPHTLEQPKPLLEIGSIKQPLMYWSMLPMILGGVSNFIVGIRYGAEKIKKKFGSGEELSQQFGRKITIEYIEEPKPLGRAGFIKYGIENGIIDCKLPSIVFNASDIIKINLRDLIRHYLWLNASYGCEIIQVYTSSFRVQYGIGEVDNSSAKVIDFKEKPLRQDLANTACYLTHRRLSDLKNIKKIPSNLEDEIIYKWIKDKILGAYIIPYENLISIKFEKDLDQVVEMNLEKCIKSIYE